jgi:hypothetical protein
VRRLGDSAVMVSAVYLRPIASKTHPATNPALPE